VTSLDQLWLATLQDVAGRAAHEVRDALNGVSLNLEVVRSRTAKGSATSDVGQFVNDAVSQLETLGARAEALLFLARGPRAKHTDVSRVLRHLAALLVPAAKADQIKLVVTGAEKPAESNVAEVAVSLGLAKGLLALIKEGGGKCRLDAGPDPVVRFSHESAVISLDGDTSAVLAEHGIRLQSDGPELSLTFPA
jgi:signal transduction histidine kinase